MNPRLCSLPDVTLPLRLLKLILHYELPLPLSRNEIPAIITIHLHDNPRSSLVLFFSFLCFFFSSQTFTVHQLCTLNSGGWGVLLGIAGNDGASRIWVNKRIDWLLHHAKTVKAKWRISYWEKTRKVTFLFSGRALNLGILAIISSSSSAVLFTLTERTRWDVSNSGSLGLVNVSLGFIWTTETSTIWVLSIVKIFGSKWGRKWDLILLREKENL